MSTTTIILLLALAVAAFVVLYKPPQPSSLFGIPLSTLTGIGKLALG